MDGARLRWIVLALAAGALGVALWMVLGGAESPGAESLGAAALPPRAALPETVPLATASAGPEAAVQPLLPEAAAADAELRLLIVREGDEAPLADVAIVVAAGPAERRGRTDAAGRLQLEVPPGALRVEVAATPSTRIVRATLAGAGEQRIVAPRRGGQVTGSVVDTGGQPIPGAEVLLWKDSPGEPVEWNRPKVSTRTDAAGAFAMPDVSGAEGDAESIVIAARLGGRASLFELASRTSALESVHGALLVLADTAPIPGHVRCADGGALGTYVTAKADCGAYLAWSAARSGARPDGDWLQRDAGCNVHPLNILLISDATEGFELPGLPDRWALTARGAGLPPARLMRDAATDASSIEMILPAPVTLRGTVRDASGAPARGARVEVAMPECFNSAVVDESGNWHIDKLPPAPVLLSVWAAGRAACTMDLDLAQTPPGPLDIVLQPGLTLAGIALDAQGRPLVAVPIQLGAVLSDRLPSGPVGNFGLTRRLAHDRCRAGHDGSFRFENLAAGRYRLELTAGPEDQIQAAVIATAGDSDVRLVHGNGLDLVARVSGRVIDAAGQARADVLIHVQAYADAEKRLLTLERDLYPDETARFTLPDMAPGWVRLDAWTLPDMRMPAAAWERVRGEPLVSLGPVRVSGGTQELELRLTR